MPVRQGRCQGGLRGLRRWAGSDPRDGSALTGDAPCQAGPAPRWPPVVRHRFSPWLAYLSAAGAVEGSAPRKVPAYK